MIAIDFESYLISEAAPIPQPICLSYYSESTGEGLVAGMQDMESKLKEILCSNQVVIAHNATFELLLIDKYFPSLKQQLQDKVSRGDFICTLINEQLIDNTRKKRLQKYSLADLVSKYFNEDISEDKKNPNAWRLRYHELENVPLKDWPEEAKKYAIDDSIWAYKVYDLQKEFPIDYRLSVEAGYYLNLMAKLGIHIDPVRIKELKTELETILKPKYEFLLERGFVGLNKLGKYKKNMNVFREHIEKLEGITIEKTAKGGVSTSTESLNRYYASCTDDVIKNYLDIIAYEKVLTSFVSRLSLAKDVIRTDYNPVVSSGRTSSRSSNVYASVNMQQMPRQVPGVKWDVRNCFIPRPGYKICSIDYSGLELASTASQLFHTLNKGQMLNTVNSGLIPVDMHSQLACRIMSIKTGSDIDYDLFMKQYKKTEEGKFYRQLSKPINLGFPGGIGYETMRSLLLKDNIETKLRVLTECDFDPVKSVKAARGEGLNVRSKRIEYNKWVVIEDELVSLKRELFKLYPDLEDFLSEYHEKFLTGETKPMKNEFGEWEKEPMYAFSTKGFKRDWCTYTEFCNGYLMQSPSSVGAKTAMVNIIKKYQDSKYLNPLAFIHDEIVFEVLDCEHMDIFIEDVSEILIDSMQSVLDCVRIAVEYDVMDYWMKSGGFKSGLYWKNAGEKELKRDE